MSVVIFSKLTYKLCKNMYLVGAGEHSKVIIEILESSKTEISGLYDKNTSIKKVFNYDVLSVKDEISGPLIVAIGDNKTRKRVVLELSVDFGQAIHESAVVSDRASIDVGSVVMQGAIIQSCASIGKHCIINTGASVDHDCKIEDFVHVSPHATLCGDVNVGEGTWIGAGATIIQGKKIGKWSVIGAGSVVVNDIPDNVLAFGNPCKVIKYLDEK